MSQIFIQIAHVDDCLNHTKLRLNLILANVGFVHIFYLDFNLITYLMIWHILILSIDYQLSKQ